MSVVIPSFNRPEFVRRAVSSVQSQSRPPVEIIVVDDGSNVPLDEKDFADGPVPVTVLRLDQNGGGGAARNAGIDLASAEWLAFLDSDDVWAKDKLFLQMAEVSRTGGPMMVATCNVLVKRPGSADRPYNRPGGAASPLSEWFLRDGQTFQTSGILIPTRLAREVRFREDLRRHQDWDFILRLQKAGAIFVYDERCLVEYDSSDSPDRVSKSKSADNTLHWFATAKHLLTPVGMYEYYLYGLLRAHLRADPVTAIKTFLSLVRGDPRGWPKFFRFTGHSVRRSVQRRWASSRT